MPDQRPATRRVVIAVAAVALAILGVLTVVQMVSGGEAPSRVVLGVENLEFSTDRIVAREGTVEVSVANTDAIAHTFTVRALDVDLEVGGGEARSVTLNAVAGTYPFVCTIPGHEGPGMRGVLEVRE